MAADSRRELIEAGVALVMEQRWQDVQASVSTRAITERAGVTTGSFFHHFRSRAHFARVLADRFAELWEANTQRVVREVEELAAVGDGAGLTGQDRAMSALQHLLWATREQPLGDDESVTGGAVLREAYRSLAEAVVPAYADATRALGREMLPPFTVDDLAVILAAFADGLLMRSGVDPDGVRDDLFADLVSALVIALTRPVSERAERSELATLEAQLGGPPPVRGDGEGARGRWRHIAEAAAPLFAERRVSEVRVSEIAAAAGVSTSTVYHQFGSVSAVAAAGWWQHLPELEAISSRPLTADEGPVQRIEQVLTRFVELCRENRGMLEGLVLEVVGASGPADDRRRRGGMLPGQQVLQTLVQPHVRELRARGVLRRRIDTEALAMTMVQVAASRVLLAPDDPVERIVDDSGELLLEGALARTSD